MTHASHTWEVSGHEALSAALTCRDFVATLPAVEPPEVFGLHSNAALARQRSEARRMLATLAAMQPHTAGLLVGQASDAALLKQVWQALCACQEHLFMVQE